MLMFFIEKLTFIVNILIPTVTLHAPGLTLVLFLTIDTKNYSSTILEESYNLKFETHKIKYINSIIYNLVN